MRGARVLAWAAIMLGLGACGGAVPLKEGPGAERSLQVLGTRRVIDEGVARARAWLDETGADRVLWGYVDRRDGKWTPVLYWMRAGACFL